MDTYRVNRYNITEDKVYTNRLIQGGQRYQKLNLSTAGELVLGKVGIKIQGSMLPIEDLSGKFECSDETLNRIWKTGARTIQRTEIEAGTTPEFYQISSEGMLCESQAPQPYSSVQASALTSYDLTFQVKPLKGGFGYTVLSDTLGTGIYILVNVENGSIAAYAGSTDLDGSPLAEATLGPDSIAFDTWNTIHTQVNLTEISVSINDAPVFNFSQTSSFYGSFGLGASFQHKALYQNVTLSTGGSDIFHSSLTSKENMEDFLAGTNPLSVSVDGARRDRIAYAGDLDITIRSTLASTYGLDYLNGSFELLGSNQLTPGFFVPTTKIQQHPRTALIDANVTGLIGYSFNLVSAMGDFYTHTGSTPFARRWAPAITRMLDWAHSQSAGPTGLFNVTDPALGGDWNYYDPPQSGVVAKFNAAYAYALQAAIPLLSAAADNTANDTNEAEVYTARLTALRAAMNEHLWSANLSAYALSTTEGSGRTAFAQDANALALLAGVPASTNQSAALLAAMRAALFLPSNDGVLAFSPAASTDLGFARLSSPYASGYHLHAALAAGDADSAAALLDTVFAPMADPRNANYTGCFWETLTVEGRPGLGDATSLCHAWGAAATGELSRWVLGIAPVEPGYSEWVFRPGTMGGRVGWARGGVETPYGRMEVEWSVEGGWGVILTSPRGTVGRVELPEGVVGGCEGFEVNGGVCDGVGFVVEGGGRFELRQV
ncbi:putative alpha-L-rhamnosidase C [Lasiodiplodia theobromae]|uniref:putative alpha-L-rhamnosidase C n=1 Tax=Lasiodiplodia theobromae TaxID=45133 RepID=UPI0015C31B92|nr:putative alpha-L-rhamnosidase C [Lasiodiplodia theobromae]KAF4545890.1 putative alpha-L-rhamnosidase C [Lasiodiplodia theobromae]